MVKFVKNIFKNLLQYPAISENLYKTVVLLMKIFYRFIYKSEYKFIGKGKVI